VPRLSACLIVKDEERFLPACLASLEGVADELVVVDTGSTDRTVELARAAGAIVDHFRWCEDFAAARNASLERASGEWVLVIDADERLDPSTRPALERALDDPSAQAWLVEVVSGDDVVAQLPRLFRRRDDVRFERAVHESVGGALAALGIALRPSGVRFWHDGYRPEVLADRDKHARNEALLERAVERDSGDLFARFKLASTLRARGDVGAALAQYEEASAGLDRLSADERRALPFAVRASLELVELAVTSGALGRAQDEAQRARRRWSERELGGEGWLTLACLALRMEAFDEAERAFESAHRWGTEGLDSVRWGSFTRRSRHEAARCALEAGRLDVAVERAHGADPGSEPGTVAVEVRAELRRGRLEEAFACFGRLLERAPEEPETMLLAGEISWWRGERAQALDLWSALAPGFVAPESLAARRARAWGLVAALADGHGDGVRRALDADAPIDVTTAAARLIAEITEERPPTIEPAFDRPALIVGVGRWLEELLQSGGLGAVERFAAGAARHAPRWPGLDRLVVRG